MGGLVGSTGVFCFPWGTSLLLNVVPISQFNGLNLCYHRSGSLLPRGPGEMGRQGENFGSSL